MSDKEPNLLTEVAPFVKSTLEWMVADAIKRNDETKPGDYSDELQIAINMRDFYREIAE